MKTRFLALLMLVAMLMGVLSACGEAETTTTQPPVTYMVVLDADENFTVEGSSQQWVAEGQTAEFSVRVNSGYEVSYLSGGTYDPAAGKLTIENITDNTIITMRSAVATGVAVSITGEHFTVDGPTYVRVDKGETVEFMLGIEKGYTVVSVEGGEFNSVNDTVKVTNVQKDTVVVVHTALKENCVNVSFVGDHFSFDGTSKTMVVEKGQPFSIFPILEQGYGITDVSGATFNMINGCIEIDNPQANMTVTVNTAKRSITYHGIDGGEGTVVDYPDFTFYTAPNCRWDDGGFSNPGYALMEYSIAPDGSVGCYSLGSKITFAPNQANVDLYCIWRPESAASDFTYATHSFNYTYSYRDWSVSGGPTKQKTVTFTGVAITSYKGNDDFVVIPAKLGGKDVIGIKAGAFQNKSMTTLAMTKSLKEVQAGAFAGCSSLDTLYFSDSILSIPNEAFDEATYSNLHHFYLNATTAPRYTYTYDGMYRVKWDAVVNATKPRIVIIGGSSVNYGVSSAYLEALMSGEYDVINYGTIRTTCQRLYVEALASQLGEGDILIYAPENSSAYTMGSGKLDTFKIFRDTEGVYNMYRHVDIANYSDYFKGITDYNLNRYASSAQDYNGYSVPSQDLVGKHGGVKLTYPDPFTIINADGDMIGGTNKNKAQNGTPKFTVNFSEYVYDEGDKSATGSNVNDYADLMAAALQLHEDKGVKVFFGFAPVSKKALSTAAALAVTQKAYDADVRGWYGVDVLGSCSNHIFDYTYMSQNDSHHLTDKGRVLHTYQLYLELCEALGITNVHESSDAVGKNFPGCAW